MLRRVKLGAACLALVVMAGAEGCDTTGAGGSSGGGASMDEMAAAVDRRASSSAGEASAEGQQPAESVEPPEATQETPPPDGRRVAGRERVGEGGYFTAIVGARRHVLNTVEGLAWKQAVQHFKATEGRKPKDHEEFMQKIVIPVGIDLGFKEENQEFLYDPSAESEGDLGVLYVVEKAEESPPQ